MKANEANEAIEGKNVTAANADKNNDLLGFNFEESIPLAAEKKERQKAQSRERQRVWKSRHQPAKLEERWSANLASLSEPERDALQALRRRNAELIRYMLDTVQGIANGRTAGRDLLFPDLLFVEIKQHLAEHPPVQSVTLKEHLVNLSAKELETFDDRARVEFGIETRIWEGLWIEFCRWALIWAAAHPNECDPVAHKELRVLVAPHDYTSTPVVPPLPTFISERERQGYINAAQAEREQREQTAAEQQAWLIRNLGQGT